MKLNKKVLKYDELKKMYKIDKDELDKKIKTYKCDDLRPKDIKKKYLIFDIEEINDELYNFLDKDLIFKCDDMDDKLSKILKIQERNIKLD